MLTHSPPIATLLILFSRKTLVLGMALMWFKCGSGNRKREVLPVGKNGDPNGCQLEPDMWVFAGIRFAEGMRTMHCRHAIRQSHTASGD